MRKGNVPFKTDIVINKSYEGEPLEWTLARVTQTKEPIDNASPAVYTERKDGVLPETDIRTDRWEVAREAMDKVHQSRIAKRTSSFKEEKTTGEPTNATGENAKVSD